MESYIEAANASFAISQFKLEEILITSQTIQRINYTNEPQLLASLNTYYKLLSTTRQLLGESIWIHNSNIHPDEPTIRAMIDQTSEINALMYDIDELLGNDYTKLRYE